MAVFYRSASQTTVASSGVKNTWSAARDAISSTSFTNYPQGNIINTILAIGELADTSGRDSLYQTHRTFLFFNLSNVNGTITALDLEINSGVTTNPSMNVLVAKSSAFGGNGTSAFVSSDFNSWITNSPTPYSPTSGQAWTDEYDTNTFTLNNTSISDANTNGYLNVVLLGSSNDYSDITPTSDFDRVAYAMLGGYVQVKVTYTLPPWDYVINGVSAKTILLSGYTKLNNVNYTTIESVNNIPPFEFNYNIGTGFNDEVNTITVQPNDQILVGGDFTIFNGNTRNRLVRLNSDGTEDASFSSNIGFGFNDDVKTITVQPNDQILVGGFFTSFNGNTRNSIVRLNSDGTEDTDFYDNLGTGFSTGGSTLYITAITVQTNNQILVGGSFTNLNENSRKKLVRLDSDGTEDANFYNNLGTGFGSAIFEITVQTNNQILVGGTFISFNSNSRKRLVRLDSDGTEDTDFYDNLGSGFNSTLRSIVVQPNNQILVGGDFTTFKGNSRNRLVRLNSTGTEDANFYNNLGTGFNQNPSDIILQSTGQIVVGGDFLSVDGNTRYFLARINSSGTVDTSFGTTSTQTNASVRAITQTTTGDIIVGGNFTNWAGDVINRIVGLDSDGLILP